MGLWLETAADPAVVGFDCGWKIELRTADTDTNEPIDEGMMTLTRSSYFAEVKVERTASFRAPTFSVIIEGLSDKDYGKVVGGAYVFVKVLLGYRDLASGGLAPFKDIGAMFSGSAGDDGNYHEVLHGRLQSFERMHGDFRYRTKFTGIDYRFDKLRSTNATQPTVDPGSPARAYAEALAQQAGVPIVIHPADEPGQAIDETITIPEESTVSGALQHLARAAHGDGQDQQIPMFIGLDGLHFGNWRAPVVTDAETKRLELRTGLVETKPVVEPDPNTTSGNPYETPTILRFDITLRGRADINVGDKVEAEVDVPSPGSLTSTVSNSIFGGIGDVVSGIGDMFGASPEPDYSVFRVVSVKHELDRTKGFVTTLRVERQDDDEPISSSTEPEQTDQSRALDEAARTAVALANRSRTRRAEVRLLDVGEVNAQSVASGQVGNRATGAQRIDVQEGLERDGGVNSTVRSNRAETPTQLFNKPYMTPYAFGNTGLVIPHYPGTRVVDLHYREDVSQSIVAGCLWADGQEPASQLGDYWLSLPTQVGTKDTIADSREAQGPSGPAMHDLIDATGGRAIHVRGLRISVGEGKLVDAGTRPDNATTDEILIEHKSGAKFHIDADGNITISTDGDITFEANKINMNVNDAVEVS